MNILFLIIVKYRFLLDTNQKFELKLKGLVSLHSKLGGNLRNEVNLKFSSLVTGFAFRTPMHLVLCVSGNELTFNSKTRTPSRARKYQDPLRLLATNYSQMEKKLISGTQTSRRFLWPAQNPLSFARNPTCQYKPIMYLICI